MSASRYNLRATVSHWSNHPGRQMLEGGIRNLLSEALFPLTALITAGFLTRRGGPADYGVLVLAVTLVVWIQWSLNSVFSRPTIKHVGEAKDWGPIGTAAVNLQLQAGLSAMVILWILAIPLSRLLGEPRLAGALALLALDIPLFCLVHAHRNILTGIGAFGHCAMLSASRWIVRLILIVGLIEGGLTISAAILGTIGASIVELMLARQYVRPALFRRVSIAEWPLWDYALPVFLSALSVSTFLRLDLFAVKVFGGSAVQAGQYGAAQNLAQMPGLFVMAIAPFLLSTLSRVLASGDAVQARDLGRNALRFGVILVSIAAAVAGDAKQIVSFFFGEAFEPSAALLAILILGSSAMLLLTVSTTILVAMGHPGVTIKLTVLLVPLAVIGHLFLVPRFGAVGAAGVTASLELCAAIASVFAVSRLWDLGRLGSTVLRSFVVSGFAYVLGAIVPVSGAWVLIKLAFIGVLIIVAYWGLGEWSAKEVSLGRSLLGMRIIPGRPSVVLAGTHPTVDRLALQAS